MRTLFVTGHLASDFSQEVEGCYKRTKMLLDALGGISELSILAYVSPKSDFSPSGIAQREAEVSRFLGIPVRLYLSPKYSAASKLARIRSQLFGAFSLFEQSAYLYTSRQRQTQDFKACLEQVQPDALFIHRLSSMPPVLQSRSKLPPIFFDLDDIEHIKYSRSILHVLKRYPWRSLYFSHALALRRTELKAIRLSQATFVCSEQDQEYLAQRVQPATVVTVPNAIAIPEPRPLTDSPTLMLLGGYYYTPNRQAADFLIEQVFPLIREAVPNARLLIAGRNPENIRTYSQQPEGVEFLGFIEDLDQLYAQTQIVCCPIFVGGGTRVKMVEAAAYGKPIVATTIGAEGLDMVNNADYLLRDSPTEFAQGCIQLLQDQVYRQKLGNSARAIALAQYDRANIIRQIQQQISAQLAPASAPVNSKDPAPTYAS